MLCVFFNFDAAFKPLYMFAASEQPYDTICYPCGKWSQDYNRPPGTRVWGPKSVSRGQNYFTKFNTPFKPSQRNYLKFKKVNDAIDGLLYHQYILPTLPQWVDFSSLAIAYNRKNYYGIKWKPGTTDIVINRWLNHLEHPDNVASCRISCTCTGGSTT